MEKNAPPEQFVVIVRHSGYMTSDRDKPNVVFGPASEDACNRRRDEMNAYNDWGSTSWASVIRATVDLVPTDQ